MAMKTQIRPAGLKINSDLKPASDSAVKLGGELDTSSATYQSSPGLHTNIVSGLTIGNQYSTWAITYTGVVSGAGSAATNASAKLSSSSQSLSSSSSSIILDSGSEVIDVSIGDLILAKSGSNYMPFIVLSADAANASSLSVKYHGGITSSGITIVSSISGVVTDIHKPSLSSGGVQTASNATLAGKINPCPIPIKIASNNRE